MNLLRNVLALGGLATIISGCAQDSFTYRNLEGNERMKVVLAHEHVKRLTPIVQALAIHSDENRLFGYNEEIGLDAFLHSVDEGNEFLDTMIKNGQVHVYTAPSSDTSVCHFISKDDAVRYEGIDFWGIGIRQSTMESVLRGEDGSMKMLTECLVHEAQHARKLADAHDPLFDCRIGDSFDQEYRKVEKFHDVPYLVGSFYGRAFDFTLTAESAFSINLDYNGTFIDFNDMLQTLEDSCEFNRRRDNISFERYITDNYTPITYDIWSYSADLSVFLPPKKFSFWHGTYLPGVAEELGYLERVEDAINGHLKVDISLQGGCYMNGEVPFVAINSEDLIGTENYFQHFAGDWDLYGEDGLYPLRSADGEWLGPEYY